MTCLIPYLTTIPSMNPIIGTSAGVATSRRTLEVDDGPVERSSVVDAAFLATGSVDVTVVTVSEARAGFASTVAGNNVKASATVTTSAIVESRCLITGTSGR